MNCALLDWQFLVGVITCNAVMLLGSCHDLLPRVVCTARLTKWVALLKQLGQTVRTGSIRQVLRAIYEYICYFTPRN